MPPVIPNPQAIRSFASMAAFEAWLSAHHDRETEVWIRIFKKATGTATVTPIEAIDVALCWGWIDAIRKSWDEVSYLQRFTPRGRKSLWSQVNRENVARLTAEGRMTPHGLRHVEAARADGRWDNAYAPIRAVSADTLPADLMEAIRSNPAALTTFGTLNRTNLFALGFRVGSMKTPAGRARKIAALVATLEQGDRIV